MTERWKPVVGFEHLYEVSDQGRVRRSAPGKGTRVGTILTPRPTRKGYLRVRLPDKDFSIHRLVLTAFDRPPSPGEECNHRDGIKTNNCLANLEWVTPKQNSAHALNTGLRKPLTGERNGRTKITAEQAAEIKRLRGKETQRVTAARFGISDVRVSQIQRAS